VCYEHPFAFSPSAISVMPLSQEHVLGWPYLTQIKSDHYGWPSMMTSSEGPRFYSCLAPPNPKPTTVSMDKWLHQHKTVARVLGTDADNRSVLHKSMKLMITNRLCSRNEKQLGFSCFNETRTNSTQPRPDNEVGKFLLTASLQRRNASGVVSIPI